MIIRKIEVKNFRKLIGPVVISGLEQGVNVIAGDNEEGKSTLFTALRSAFFLKHSTTGQAVENLLPYGSQVRPEVSVDFELDGGKYSLSKSFCLKPFQARLKSPGGTVEGSAVEEQLNQILMCPAGTGKKTDQDKGFWGLLWLEQAAALDGLMMSDGGRQTLLKAVESDIGTVLGGKSGRALMNSITRLYGDFFTAARADATKEYKKSKDLVETVGVELESCRKAYKEYESKVDDLTHKRDLKAALRRDNALAKAKDLVKVVDEKVQKLTKLKQEFESCHQAQKTLRAEYNNVKQQFEARALTRADAEKSVAEVQKAEQAVIEAQKALAGANAAVAKAQNEITDLQKQIKEHESLRRRLEVAELRAKKEQSRTELNERLASAKAKLQQLDQVAAQYKAIKLDDKALPNLRQLQRAASDAEARATAASTRLVLHPSEGKQAFAFGEELEADSTVLISESTTLELAEWGTVEVHPGGENVAAKRKEAEKLQTQLSAALANCGVESLDQAEELAVKKQELKGTSELLAGELKILVPSGVKALEAQLAQIATELTESDSADPVTYTPEQLADLVRELEQLRKQEEAENKNLSALTNAAHQAEIAQKEWSTRVDSAKKQQDINQSRLDQMALEDSDENLKTKLSEALHKCSLKEKELELVQAGLNALDPVAISDESESAQKQLRAVTSQLDNLERNIDILAAEVDTLGKQGPGERLQEFEGKFEKATQQLESMERQARAVKLLYDTMKACEKDAKEQFMEPVQMRLRPYLNEVFPGTDVALDQSQFEIAGLQRNSHVEKYNSLSIGTREQISVLTRLAIAGLLKEKGYPAVVVLDDVLVYSDERRFDLMKQVLRRAATEHNLQILILTCRKRDYADFESIIDLSACTASPAPAVS